LSLLKQKTTIKLKKYIVNRGELMTFANKNKQGSLEVICGPMFSGKSEELIRRLRRAAIAKHTVIAFKHAFDNRQNTEKVLSHNGNTFDAYATADVQSILTYALQPHISVVGIDEVQFYTQEIIAAICTLIDAGKKVIVSGLNLDFRGIPFGPMSILLPIADSVTKLTAICIPCGSDASFSQRLVNGNPAKCDDPIILIGAKESYQARCRDCFLIDKKPNFAALDSTFTHAHDF
jgi:thymidine kinase